ncbi:MAG: hypothetical protein WC852_07750 [Candidatus Nanoarchaeia archaeon]|jgi:hypothetical protein
MSLVDKLKDVHVGDLVLLHDKDVQRVGFVFNYSADSIKLSNKNTRNKDGTIRSDSVWRRYADEKVVNLPLGMFDSYEILKKYE